MINTTSQPIGLYDNYNRLVQWYRPNDEHRFALKVTNNRVVERHDNGIPVFSMPVWVGLAGKLPVDESVDLLVSPQVGQFIATEHHQVDGRRERIADTMAAAGIRVYGPNMAATEGVVDASGRFLGSRSLVRYA